MPRADYYREQARRLALMARATRHADFAAQLEAQARLYLSLARVPERSTNDLNSVLNGFNAQQMRHLRELWDEEQTGPVPEHLARLLAQLEAVGSSPAGVSGAKVENQSSGTDSAESRSSARAKKS